MVQRQRALSIPVGTRTATEIRPRHSFAGQHRRNILSAAIVHDSEQPAATVAALRLQRDATRNQRSQTLLSDAGLPAIGRAPAAHLGCAETDDRRGAFQCRATQARRRAGLVAVRRGARARLWRGAARLADTAHSLGKLAGEESRQCAARRLFRRQRREGEGDGGFKASQHDA